MGPTTTLYYLQGYELMGDQEPHTLGITDGGIFRECKADADCPKPSYCDNGAGKTPPYFCHGPTL